MENKKTLKINCAICDARKVTDEVLSAYDKVQINAATLITSPAAQVLLGRYAAKVNAANILPLEDNVRFTQFNGAMKIRVGQSAAKEKTCLLLNGSLDIETGSEEALKSYAAIIVNGSAICPESIAGLLGDVLTVNGSFKTYPDGCIRLKNTVVLDRFFHLRVRQDALYYASKRVIALEPDIDFGKLTEKNVRFSTKKLLVSETLAEAAVPLFDEKTDITVLPDGCAFVADDAELDEALLKRYGGKLYIAGDLTVGAKAAGLLDQVSFLRVDGDLLVAGSLKDRVLSMDAEYERLYTVGGTVLATCGSQNITAYLLGTAEDGLSAVNCTHISIDADVTPELLRGTLVSVINCASVTCATQEQLDVVGLVAHNVASVSLDGQSNEQDDEEDGNTVRINSSVYTF